MKRLVLVLILFMVACNGPTPTVSPLQPEAFNSPLPGWPPVPPVDLEGIEEYMGLAGLSTLVLIVIEVLKRLGLVPDGQAARWASLCNIVGFALLAIVGVFGVDFVDNTNIQTVLDLLVRICQAVLTVLGSPLLFKLLRNLEVLPALKGR